MRPEQSVSTTPECFESDYIASELNKRGLPSDRITKTGEGGISDYVPTEANRHSKVELFFDKLEKTEIHP